MTTDEDLLLPEPLVSFVPEFCRRNHISRLEVFGSVARGDANPASDLDLMLTFQAGQQPGLFAFSSMQEELERCAGRRVDLLTRRAVESDSNWIRRTSILADARTVYAE